MSLPDPPRTLAELRKRAQALAGLTLGDIAAGLGRPVPADLQRHKGWVGELIEAALGAEASSLPEPDFLRLGVELKTLPVNAQGLPQESTYVCTVPLGEGVGGTWETSWVRRKLAHVLWLPVQGDRAIPLAKRRAGQALLWQPDAHEEALLRRDYEELMELVCTGKIEQISARLGEVMQIRPKAANARARREAVGVDGRLTAVNPRGFYLRAAFTAALLRRHYAR